MMAEVRPGTLPLALVTAERARRRRRWSWRQCWPLVTLLHLLAGAAVLAVTWAFVVGFLVAMGA